LVFAVVAFFAQIDSILTSHFPGECFVLNATFHQIQKRFHSEILSKVICLPSEFCEVCEIVVVTAFILD